MTMPTIPRLRIDEYAPEFDVRSAHQVTIARSMAETYAALLSTNFSDSKIIRGLMKLRGYGRETLKANTAQQLLENLRRGGFLEIEVVPEEEIVFGIAGRFWRPDGGIINDLSREDFVEFKRPGYLKAVWNFSLAKLSENQTLLRTQTRVICYGSSAKWKFKIYWFFVGPFSGLIRTAMLRQVKARATSGF
jgi:hypothetical protein